MTYETVESARGFLLDKLGVTPDVAIVTGSGLAGLDRILTGTKRWEYRLIPDFPVPKIAGHSGQVIQGAIAGLNVVIFEGRVHYYEGYGMEEVTFCARVIGRLGAETLILTNASGGVNAAFGAGSLVLISDHINMIGVNPLRGPNEDRWGPRFVDQTAVYDPELREQIRKAAGDCGIDMREGVYLALPGPTYETPAEIRMLRTLGADCVGMSTVPEAMVARHMGLRVAGISMISNIAAGLGGPPITHQEVLKMGRRLSADVARLLQKFLGNYEH